MANMMPGDPQRANVLIVEDDEEMRALLKSLVLGLGYNEVLGLARLDHALQRMEYDAFSLAIVDLNLGIHDGVSLISAIRSNPRHCVGTMPVLVASTAAVGPRIQSALLAGADGFLCKPFTIANLKRQIRFATSKAQARCCKHLIPAPPARAPSIKDLLVSRLGSHV